MNILVTGAAGMLGTDLCAKLAGSFPVTGVGLNPAEKFPLPYLQADLSDSRNVASIFAKEKPAIVFHAAAMTDVDRCESDREEAVRANLTVTQHVVNAANGINACLVFFSTDYVFSGDKKGMYTEEDPVSPGNYYGETKVLAEDYIRERCRRFIIFRISWLYGLNGKSFPRTILEKAAVLKEFEIVSDQVGRPTYTQDVSAAMRDLLRDPALLDKKGNQIYHLSNDGTASWAQFGRFILDEAGYQGTPVREISSAKLARPAKRPANSVMSLEKAAAGLGLRLRPWQEAAREFIKELQQQRTP
jgi:dTDP-4-dehydrorhamnose reductase